jgi:DNA-binding transcriptional ArsR family regulator
LDTACFSRFDSGQLSDIIHELNISRNHVSAYPKGHPVIASSCERLALRFRHLLDMQEEIAVGITKDSLIVQNFPAGRNSFAVKEFAETLFRQGIAVITFRQGLTPDEIVRFNEVLLEKREHIREKGGIEQAVALSGIQGIRISQVRYDEFQLTEQDTLPSPSRWDPALSPWEIFVTRLLKPVADTRKDLDGGADPRILAELINNLYDADSFGKGTPLTASIETFLAELATADLSLAAQADFFRKIGAFAGHLQPELLNQFIVTAIRAFGTKQPDCSDCSEDSLADSARHRTSYDIIGNAALPPLVMNLVDTLAKHAAAESDPARTPLINQSELRELAPKLTLLFREDRTDEFVPPQYLKALSMIVNSDSFLEEDREDQHDLSAALDKGDLDYAVGEIIIEIVDSGMIENPDKIRETLLEIFKYCLQTGDYASLIKLMERTVQHDRSATDEAGHIRSDLFAFLESDDFVEEIMTGLDTWGKDKYHDIGLIIRKVGKAFIETLLDRLADEQNLSRRRYYLSHLIELAQEAKEPAIRRLGDSRWYVLRNLIQILRRSGDATVMRHLKRLADHPHPKVRQNVLETHLHFNSSESVPLLLREMKNSDPETRITAIQLAGKSTSHEIVSHLLSLLQRGRIAPSHLAARKAAVGALADMGNSAAIPVLDAILSKRKTLFRPGLVPLQIDIINTLDRYPCHAARLLLEKTARSGNAVLAKAAAEKLQSMGGRGA